MDVISVVQTIKDKFSQTGSSANVPLIKGSTFQAKLMDDGISVDNLGNQPFLPWAVFQEAICVMIRQGGSAIRGDAMQSKLGDVGLPFNSIEGHIAQVVYGKKVGEAVFRRITPIACILIWAGVCKAKPGELALSN